MFLGIQNRKVKFYTDKPLDKVIYNLDSIEETDQEYGLCGEEYLLVRSPEYKRYQDNIRKIEILARLEEIDSETTRPLRAILTGLATDEDRDKLTQLETEARDLRNELKELS